MKCLLPLAVIAVIPSVAMACPCKVVRLTTDNASFYKDQSGIVVPLIKMTAAESERFVNLMCGDDRNRTVFVVKSTKGDLYGFWAK